MHPGKKKLLPTEGIGTGSIITAFQNSTAVFYGLENLTCTFALILMAILPLLEIGFRAFDSPGIPGSAVWTQHLVLWTAFFGAAIAARKGELLSLATESLLPKSLLGPGKTAAAGIGLAVCVFLTMGGALFVLAERKGGQTLALGIPTWALQLVIPAGFALIGMRIWWRASIGWKNRLTAFGIAAVPFLLIVSVDLRETPLVWILSGGIILGLFLGAPIFVGLGGIAAVLLWNGYEPVSAIPVEVYNLTVKPLLPTIPLFTLAGYILANGGTPNRLVDLFRALFGWMPGGVAIVAILACAFFTSFTGGSGVTIVALGGLMYPMLIQEQYKDKLTTGLLTSAGSLGLMLPPSLAVILYAVVAQVDVRELFISGLVPAGIEISLVILFVSLFSCPTEVRRVPFDLKTALKSIQQAGWEVATPIVIIIVIFGGYATLVETAAVTVLYAIILEFFIRRNLSLKRDLLRIVSSASTLIGGVLMILGVAMGLTNFLVIEEIPLTATTWVQSFVDSQWIFLFLLNLFLLAVGCLMDIYSAITVMVPILAPIGLAFGIDPVHMGIIFLINLELGYLTPPVGMNLFLAAYRFNRRLDEVYRSTLPFLGIRIFAVLLVTYVPFLTSWLPSILELRGSGP